jgi:hypothetical protein
LSSSDISFKAGTKMTKPSYRKSEDNKLRNEFPLQPGKLSLPSIDMRSLADIFRHLKG